MSPPDAKLISSNGTVVTSYWFLGCTYLGPVLGLSFPYNYSSSDVDRELKMRVFVVVSPPGTDNNTVAGDESLLLGNTTTVAHPFLSQQITSDDCDDSLPLMPTLPRKYYGFFSKSVVPTGE